MADNVTAPAAGIVFATDDLSGVHYPYSKLAFGADGAAVPVADANGARLPVTVGAALPAGTNNIGDVDVLTVPLVATTTREYAAGYRAAVVTAATTFAISGNITLGASREVRIRASAACWLRFGTAGTGQDAAVPATGSAALSMPIDANQAEVLRVPAGATHISVIRESADGAVTFTPVA